MSEWVKVLVDMVPLIVVVGLCIWRELENKRMIDSLMDRLMAKNLYEFKRAETRRPIRMNARKIPSLTDAEMADLEEQRSNDA